MSRRTGRADFPHPALRRDSGQWPTGRRVGRTCAPALARSVAPESLGGGDRQHGHSPDASYFRSTPEVRPLPSTDITRLQRYYEPVRHPTRPGLSLAGVRSSHALRCWGFPCCVRSPCADMLSPLPRWDHRRGCCRSPRICDGGLPHPFAGSAPTLRLSRPARRSLTLRPVCSRSRPRRPFPSKASAVSLPPLPLRLLPAGATPYRVGVSPTEDGHLSRRTA
jgi:hypothetical protein